MLILAVNVLAVNGALPLYIVSKMSYALHIASKSVFYTPSSVQKCLIDALSVLLQVFDADTQAASGQAMAASLDPAGQGKWSGLVTQSASGGLALAVSSMCLK